MTWRTVGCPGFAFRHANAGWIGFAGVALLMCRGEAGRVRRSWLAAPRRYDPRAGVSWLIRHCLPWRFRAGVSQYASPTLPEASKAGASGAHRVDQSRRWSWASAGGTFHVVG